MNSKNFKKAGRVMRITLSIIFVYFCIYFIYLLTYQMLGLNQATARQL